jgi:hypothetical protein
MACSRSIGATSNISVSLCHLSIIIIIVRASSTPLTNSTVSLQLGWGDSAWRDQIVLPCCPSVWKIFSGRSSSGSAVLILNWHGHGNPGPPGLIYPTTERVQRLKAMDGSLFAVPCLNPHSSAVEIVPVALEMSRFLKDTGFPLRCLLATCTKKKDVACMRKSLDSDDQFVKYTNSAFPESTEAAPLNTPARLGNLHRSGIASGQ